MTGKKTGRLYAVLLAAVIILQCITLVYIFAAKKTSYHEDEVFSYGLSNSYKYPFLYGSASYVADNYDVWLTGDTFKNYIRTNEETRFRYDSVWSNQAEDLTPPLYYAILHTICSVNTGKFSWWYAFAINLVCFLITQVFLYMLAAKLSRSELTGLLVCAFWGFTLIVQSNFIFLRMYAMATMFTVMYAYMILRLVCGDKLTTRSAVLTGLVVFLGAMTQHFFLVSAFILTALVCLWLLIKKDIKTFFGAGISALAGVLLSFAVFPATIDHMKPGRVVMTEEPDISFQMSNMGWQILRNTTGIRYINPDFMFYVIAVLGVLIPISIPLIFLFRNEPWMKRFASGLKENTKAFFREKKLLHAISPAAVMLLILCAVYYVIVSGTYYYFDFGEDSERYYYQIIPFIVLIAVWFVMSLLLRIKKDAVRRVFCGMFAAFLTFLLVFQHVLYKPVYLKEADTENGYIREYTAGNDCILISYSAIFLPVFTRMLEDADDVYFTLFDDGAYRDDRQLAEYQKIFDRDEPFILLLDESAFSKEEDKYSEDIIVQASYKEEMTEKYILGWFEEKSGRKAERLTAEFAHENTVAAYRFS